MTNIEMTVPEDRRREIFRTLVEAQDQAMSVAQSKKVIATQFGIDEYQMRRIEREGLDGDWPPL